MDKYKPFLNHLRLKGFKAFRDISIDFGKLEVIVGANGTGKTSIFEFLKFIREGITSEIPTGMSNLSGQEVFNVNTEKDDSERVIRWFLHINSWNKKSKDFTYKGSIIGPRWNFKIADETLMFDNDTILDRIDDKYNAPNSLLLGRIRPFDNEKQSLIKSFIINWGFYLASQIDIRTISKSAYIEQQPFLTETFSNISSVLHYLMTEHPDLFEELHRHLRSVIPSFRKITVKARGGPGEVIAFWREEGIDRELTIADLSDGVIRLLCWITLCLHPEPPTLICIDEPELGVHPRALPILAGLFKKASERTQLLIATHSSYFLTQFDIGDIAVMIKENGEASYLKPKDSKILTGMLEDFGPDEIEAMHRSDELEHFA